jgi:hypothetical protein
LLSLRAPVSRRALYTALALIAGYVALMIALVPWATLRGPAMTAVIQPAKSP